MKPGLESILNTRFGIGLALTVGRIVPPGVGYRLINRVSDRIASNVDSPHVRALRANLWVATGCSLTAEELDEAVRDTYRHHASCLHNLYHYRSHPSTMLHLVAVGPEEERFVEERVLAKQGLVIAGIHLSNFDLLAQLGAIGGLRALTLSAADPPRNYLWVNALRSRTGWEVVPASMASLRLAIKRLRSGGTVMSGIDRPFPGSKYRPEFFGRPAALPVFHIQLALTAEVPLMVVAAIQEPDGLYHLLMSDLIYPEHHPDRRAELTQNAETVLRVAEEYIRRAPRQWAMFYPVWPEALDGMP